MYLIYSPRQLFFQCGLETPKVWTPLKDFWRKGREGLLCWCDPSTPVHGAPYGGVSSARLHVQLLTRAAVALTRTVKVSPQNKMGALKANDCLLEFTS